MNSTTLYQVVLVDEERQTFSPANGNGMTARKFPTVEEALEDMRNWVLMFRSDPRYHLAVQRVECTVILDSKISTAELWSKVVAEGSRSR